MTAPLHPSAASELVHLRGAVLRLQEAVGTLEEDNRQLRDTIRGEARRAPIAAMKRVFTITEQQAQILCAISGGRAKSAGALAQVCSKVDHIVSDLTIRVQVQRLRKKLEPHRIKVTTDWGVGFRIDPESCSRLAALIGDSQ